VNPSVPGTSTKKTTIKDIAAAARVSTATVSRILTSADSAVRFSEPTRQRVLAIARQLNYTPNALASGLRSRQTRMIGVIVPDAAMQYCAAIVSALEPALGDRDYDFLLAQARSGSDVHRSSRTFERYRVDGVILVSDWHDEAFLDEYLHELHGHAVGLGRESIPGLPCVNIDNRLGVQMAIDYLISQGEQRIAYATTWRGWDMQQRLDAYAECLASAGLRFVPEYVLREGACPDIAAGARATERLLALPTSPAAILYANDEMAIGGMATLQRHGLSVPSDIAVIGFDDIPWSSYCSPTLTTVRQPIKDMVIRAVGVLIDMIEEKQFPANPESLVFAPELIVRGSTVSAPTDGRLVRPRPLRPKAKSRAIKRPGRTGGQPSRDMGPAPLLGSFGT
jgi:DNA-binding LacI/PurR family transcriptional regulator